MDITKRVYSALLINRALSDQMYGTEEFHSEIRKVLIDHIMFIYLSSKLFRSGSQ
jgi:hypothetical protein